MKMVSSPASVVARERALQPRPRALRSALSGRGHYPPTERALDFGALLRAGVFWATCFAVAAVAVVEAESASPAADVTSCWTTAGFLARFALDRAAAAARFCLAVSGFSICCCGGGATSAADVTLASGISAAFCSTTALSGCDCGVQFGPYRERKPHHKSNYDHIPTIIQQVPSAVFPNE